MVKHKGVFWDFADLSPRYETSDYENWNLEQFKKAADWYAEHGFNTFIFHGFDFCDTGKYPFMKFSERSIGSFFSEFVEYARSKNINSYAGFRLCMSDKFTSANPDCRAIYQNTNYLFRNAAWCPNDQKVRAFLKDCTKYYMEKHNLSGVLFHSSEAPKCECPECSGKELWESTVDLLKELKPVVDENNGESLFVPCSNRGFDEHLEEIDSEIPGMVYLPWDYSDPGGTGHTVQTFTPWELEKRLKFYTDKVDRVWFIVPAGNCYMLNYNYPMPEAIQMWEKEIEKLHVEGSIHYMVRWESSHISRFTHGICDTGKSAKDIAYESACDRFGEKAGKKIGAAYLELINFTYKLWASGCGFRLTTTEGIIKRHSFNPDVSMAKLLKAADSIERHADSLSMAISENPEYENEINDFRNELIRHVFRIKGLYHFSKAASTATKKSSEEFEINFSKGKEYFEKAFAIFDDVIEHRMYNDTLKYMNNFLK